MTVLDADLTHAIAALRHKVDAFIAQTQLAAQANRTRSRHSWGVLKPHVRPTNEWLTVNKPELAIISPELWKRTQRHLSTAREVYLESTRGNAHGRSPASTVSKYLLSGVLECGQCGGGLIVKGRDSPHRRLYRYACSTYHARGRAIWQQRDGGVAC